MLKKIIYPEGGYTRFYYEHNKVFNPFPSSVVFDNPNPYDPREAHLSNIEFTSAAVYVPGINRYVYKKPFTISEGVAGGWLNYTFDNNNFAYKILNSQSNVVYNLSVIDTQVPTTGDGLGQVSLSNLPPGNYILEVTAPAGHNPTDGNINLELDPFTVHIDWLETTPSNAPILAAGKRIKKIEYRDPLNNQGITKTYDYTDPATGQTSGMLLGLPNFRDLSETVITVGGQEFKLINWHGNFPGSPLVTYQEQSQGYGTVTEFNGEGGNTLGKTVHKFTMTPDMGEYYAYPLHPPTDNEWLRGKELSVRHYKKNPNGSFSEVKKIENEYLYGGGDLNLLYSSPYRNTIDQGLENCASLDTIPLYCTNANYVKTKSRFRLPLAIFYDDEVGNVTALDSIFPQMYKAYQLTGGTVDLKKTTVTDYFDDGSQMVNTTDYSYRYDYHYNVAQVSDKTSDSNPLISKYFYVNDPEMTGKPAKADLIKKNITQVTLVTETFKGGARLSQTETVFKDWNPNDTIVRLMLPQYVKTAKGSTTPTETRIEYTKIDSDNGNILEVKKTNGIPVTYIWGYNGTYPLAKIENATFAQVTTALGSTEAALKALTVIPANIRTLMPNAMITTFTYKPLVGVTSITDSKGDVLNYEYDVFGRLEFVRDKWGNTLSKNEYIYGQ